MVYDLIPRVDELTRKVQMRRAENEALRKDNTEQKEKVRSLSKGEHKELRQLILKSLITGSNESSFAFGVTNEKELENGLSRPTQLDISTYFTAL